MATRPNNLPLFCTDNPSNREALPDSLVRSGFIADTPPAAEHFNEQLHLVGEWIRALDQGQASNTLLSTVEPSIRLLGGGRWSYASATSTLTWSDTAYLSMPSLADSANTIPAGSATVPSGSVAYIVSNAPFVTAASTASGSPKLTGVQYADQVQVGWQASGAGIPSGALVSGVDATSKTITLSANSTASASGVAVTFAGSGTLTVQVAPIASFAITANSVIIARAITAGCIVGVGSGQMRLHEQESKSLLGTGYQDVQKFTAGEALAAGQFVYMSAGASDASRTAGQVYGASAAVGVPQRAYVLGVSLYACNAGDTAYVMSEGFLPIFTGLTPGYVYYLSTATPAVPTATAPTATGASVVQLGMAISATGLMLGAPANRKPTVNAVSYPVQQVYMGTYHRAAQGAAAPESNAAFSVTAADGKLAFRQWTTGSAGHVLKIKVNSVTNLPNLVTLRIFRGNSPGNNSSNAGVLYQATGSPYTTDPGGGGAAIQAIFFPIPIGQAAFGAYDTLGLAISYPSTVQEVNAQAEFEVYTTP